MAQPEAVPDPTTGHRGSPFAFHAQIAGLLALAAAMVVLVGWITGQRDLQRLFATGVTVKANTAVGITLLAISLLGAARAGRDGGRWRLLSSACGVLALVLGAATLIQYVTGANLGIDQLFVSARGEEAARAAPGRMSAVTATLLVILGAAFVIDGWNDTFARVSQLLALTAVSLSLGMLLVYAYHAVPLAGTGHGVQIALPTILLMLMLAAAGLFLNPTQGFVRVLLAPGVGGVTARRLLPFAFVVPLVMSTVQYLAPRLYTNDVDELNAVEAVLTMLAFAAIIWLTARKLTEADRRREVAEQERTRLMIEAETQRTRAEAEHAQRVQIEHANALAQAALREKAEVQRRLLHAQKMEAVGQLAGGIAHDFNNLLTIIQGNIAFITDDLPPGDERAEYASEIAAAADRAASLTRQLLSFSRKHVGQAEPLRPDHVVRDMQQMIQRLLPSNIELVLHLEADAVAEIDRGQMEQALMNLAINARDAMPAGGRLTIASRVVTTSGDHGQPDLPVNAGEYVLVEVSDTGQGMPPEIRDRIFEPFFTTKAPGAGTGLGLSIVYGMVQEHGGTIAVSSEPGEGTTFKLYFPVSRRAAVVRPDTPRPVPTGNEVILVVDDDAGVRQIVRESLERYGYTVLEARDGEHALEVSEIFRGLPDLLLTDLMMPKVTGRELVDALELRGRRPKVLLMSGYTDDEVMRRGLRDGRYPFIQKPFSREMIARQVRAVLDQPPREPTALT